MVYSSSTAERRAALPGFVAGLEILDGREFQEIGAANATWVAYNAILGLVYNPNY